MAGLRIAMITRRFWPLVGGAEMVMANLASEFQRQGVDPVSNRPMGSDLANAIHSS